MKEISDKFNNLFGTWQFHPNIMTGVARQNVNKLLTILVLNAEEKQQNWK